MPDIHRLLERQIRRNLRGVEVDVDALSPFLKAISDAYKQGDNDRELMERAMDLSSNELQRANADLNALLQALPDQVLQLNSEGKILFFHGGVGSVGLLSDVSAVGSTLQASLPPSIAAPFTEAVARVSREERDERLEFSHAGGEDTHYFEAYLRPISDRRVIAVVRDISARRNSEAQIRHLAFHDSLTGLPNRILFQKRLQQALDEATSSGTFAAVFFLDLDRFKYINDTLGHGAGDELLVEIANRLRRCLRDEDVVARFHPVRDGRDQTTIARMGGDEFTVIVSHLPSPELVETIAHRILHEVARPFTLQGREVVTTVSVGAALFPRDGESVDSLVQHADAAMYHAKAQGKDTYQVYRSEMNAALRERLELEGELRRALDDAAFTLNYQPIVRASDCAPVSLEALIRWHHPERGFISPASFIPLAEETGLILPLGRMVVEMACAQLKAWRAEGIPDILVSVNLSSHQFRDHTIADFLAECLERYDLSPEQLGVELTETAMMDNPTVAVEVLHKIRALGIKVSLDDFGTGYSSLAYLQRLPVDTLKVDRSFVGDFTANRQEAGLVRAIISMGQVLGLQVVAEGVETAEQLAFLRESGCDLIQGYYVQRPGPPEVIAEYLRVHRIQEGWGMAG